MNKSENINHLGTVINSDGQNITVKIKRNSSCNHCDAKKSCMIGQLKEDTIQLDHKECTYEAGTNVNISMSKNSGVLSTVLAYIIPLLLIVITLKISLYYFGELGAGLISLSIMIPYLGVLYRYRDKISRKLRINIEKAIFILAICFSFEANSATVNIGVASNFLPTLKKIVKIYNKQSKDKIVIMSGSTGGLYAQFINGGPIDIFLSADSRRPEELEKKELIVDGSRKTYVIGKLAFFTPDKRCSGLIESQLNGHKQIAIANPKTAPYGTAAFQLLKKLKMEKLLKNTVKGQNVGQTFQFVKHGGISGGLVALSLLKNAGIDPNSYCEVPRNLYGPITQQLVINRSSIVKNQANNFVHFLTSNNKVKQIITQNGYYKK